MWYLLAQALPAAAAETYLGRFFEGTSSTFGGSGQYSQLLWVLGFILSFIVVNLIIRAWAKDDYFVRRSKKMPAFKMLLFLLFGPIAMLFYLASRPAGEKTLCRYCEKLKMSAAPLCPHCGRAVDHYKHHRRQATKHYAAHRASPSPAARALQPGDHPHTQPKPADTPTPDIRQPRDITGKN